MPNPFLNSAKPRFVNRDEIVGIARETARRIAAGHPDVVKVLLFGSFSRNDYGVRSDLDLLVVLARSDKPLRERVSDFIGDVRAYPTDIFPYTLQEIESRLASGDPFLARATREGIQLYPENKESPSPAPPKKERTTE